MITQRPWLSALRLFVAIMLFGFSGATAIAFQGLPKDDETPEPDDDQPGLIEDGHYVSPQFDVEITWTDAWAVGDADDPNVEFAIGGNYDGPVASDPDLGDIV